MLHSLECGAVTMAMPAAVGIATVATATHRANPADSQDALAVVTQDAMNAVIVADGMGALAGSGLAARYCAASATSLLWGKDSMSDPVALFGSIQRGLTEEAPEWLQQMDAETRQRLDYSQAFGTTLLIGAETTDALSVAYAGNGCAFHLRGDFAEFPEHMPLPWSWVNMLNPHTVSENGREALYRYLSPTSSPDMAVPSVIRLSKDRVFGDCLVLATDGLYSPDQVRRGCDPEGEVWISGEKTVVALHAALRRLFRQPGELTPDGVQDDSERLSAGYADTTPAR